VRFSSVFRLVLAVVLLGTALDGGVALWLHGTHQFLLSLFLSGVDVTILLVAGFGLVFVASADDRGGSDAVSSAGGVQQSDGADTRDTVSVFTVLREVSDGNYAVYCVGHQIEPEPGTGLLTCTYSVSPAR